MLMEICIWFLYWLLSWALYHFNAARFNYHRRWGITSLYFIAVSLPPFLIYRNDIMQFARVDQLGIFLISIFFILASMFCIFLMRYKRNRIQMMERRGDFVRMDHRYIISKCFDIIFQQIMILCLLIILIDDGMQLLKLSLVFSFIFGVSHIPILLKKQISEGLQFTAGAAIFGLSIPFLYATGGDGFIISFVIHSIFYLSLAAYPLFGRKEIFRSVYYR
jgi:hypothetical protein